MVMTMAMLAVLARTKPALVVTFVKSHSQVSSFVDDMIRYILIYRNVKPKSLDTLCGSAVVIKLTYRPMRIDTRGNTRASFVSPMNER